MPLSLRRIGTLKLTNPEPNEPPFLSAASGVVWAGNRLYCVGDDQAALGCFALESPSLQAAMWGDTASNTLRPGTAMRILPNILPLDCKQRSEAKPDFEALTIITQHHLNALPAGAVKDEARQRFPYGLLFIAGSGGMSRGGNRRSIGVVYALDATGNVIGLPTQISLEGLHAYLEARIHGDLNIEGICAHGDQLILAHRGNWCDERTGRTGQNLLIRLSLVEVMHSICRNLKVDQLDLLSVAEYPLGYATIIQKDTPHVIKYDFTDLDSISNDPQHRLIFTAAAEGVSGPFKGKIAGSSIGVIDRTGKMVFHERVNGPDTKLEGIDAWYNHNFNRIEFLAVADADDPKVAAPLYIGYITPGRK